MQFRDALAMSSDDVLSTLVEEFAGSLKDRWASSTLAEDREKTYCTMQGAREFLNFTRAERQKLSRPQKSPNTVRVP